MQRAMSRDGVPGGAIAIVKDGSLWFAAGVGLKNAHLKDPVDIGTRFRVGSITKMVTAMVVLSLADEGRLDITHPVAQYAPWFTLRDGLDRATVRVDEVLSHTAGLTYPDAIVPGERVPVLTAHPPALWSPPGEVYNYNNGGYALLGAMAATVAGIPYETLVQQRVFDPAGMTTATFDSDLAQRGNHAAGHSGSTKNPTVDDNLADGDVPLSHPAGGIFATVIDYAHLMETLMNPAQTILQSATLQAATSAQVDTHVVPHTSYGYGLTVSGDVVFHEGATQNGFATAFYYEPTRRFGVVVFLNALGRHQTPADIAKQVLELFAPPEVPPGAVHTPPADWDAYVGHYFDRYGVLGDVQVTRQNGSLVCDAPAWKIKHQTLTQLAGDTWRTAGGAPVLFWRKAGEAAMYMVARSGVATRVR